ncbi:hypothetical protein J4441_04720 [Candidatus Micrarchaeota archaeon]|nr:hypothetical protein [Candidatus Micrarchaeota archaeon]
MLKLLRKQNAKTQGVALGSFSLAGRRKKGTQKLAGELAALGFASIEEKGDSLEVTIVQGEDIDGKPHLFFRYSFGKASILCEYSLPAGTSPRGRKMECLRELFDILCAADFFQPSSAHLFASVSGIISDGCELISADATRLANTCAKLEEENSSLRKKCDLLLASSEKNELAARAQSLRNASLSERVAMLEGPSLQTLSEELYEWIRAHGGMIDVREFARQHNISPSRVEEGIDNLLKVGYIGRKRD